MDDKANKYTTFNSSVRYENRDIISNEIRSRLKPTSNPDTMEHTKEYHSRLDNHPKEDSASGVKIGSMPNMSPGKVTPFNDKQEDTGQRSGLLHHMQTQNYQGAFN